MKRKKLLLSCAKLILAFILIGFLIHSAQIKIELLNTLLQQPILFLAMLVLFFILVTVGAWRWYILNLSQGIHLGFHKSLLATYVGAAFNNILPSAVGGDIVRLFYVFKKSPQTKSKALLALFSDRLLGFLGVFVTISCVEIFNLHALHQKPYVFYLFLFCTIFCIGILSAFMFCVWLCHRIQLATWLEKYIGKYSWSKPFISFFETLSIFRIEKKTIFKGLMLSIVIQLLLTIIVVQISNIMGLPVLSFSDFLIAMGITQIVNLIPITPGGIGIGEIAFANILLILNPGVSAAYGTVLLAYRLLSMLAYLPALLTLIPNFTSITAKTSNTN